MSMNVIFAMFHYLHIHSIKTKAITTWFDFSIIVHCLNVKSMLLKQTQIFIII